MSELRKEITRDFGDFLSSHAFREIRQDSSASFGDELFEFQNTEFTIRFVQDRSQIGIDLARNGAAFVPIHSLLRKLNVLPAPSTAGN
jgi:hypothetical protein